MRFDRLDVACLVFLLFAFVTSCRHSRAPVAAPLPLPASNVVNAGTTLALRTAQVIDSASNTPGQTFAAVIARDAGDPAGQTLLAAGSPATLVLLSTTAPDGGQRFELALASVMLNGNEYLVCNPPNETGPARVGAFAGGVPGTMYSRTDHPDGGTPQIVVTSQRIHVPLGSLVTFRLDQPIRLIGAP